MEHTEGKLEMKFSCTYHSTMQCSYHLMLLEVELHMHAGTWYHSRHLLHWIICPTSGILQSQNRSILSTLFTLAARFLFTTGNRSSFLFFKHLNKCFRSSASANISFPGSSPKIKAAANAIAKAPQSFEHSGGQLVAKGDQNSQ